MKKTKRHSYMRMFNLYRLHRVDSGNINLFTAKRKYNFPFEIPVCTSSINIRRELLFEFIHREMKKSDIRFIKVVVSNSNSGYDITWHYDPANAIDKNFIPDKQLLNF